MKKTKESGHAKNAANFDELITYVTGYGLNYNPSKATIKLLALQTLSTNSKNAIGSVNNALAAYKNAVSAREVAFEPLGRLSTRILNAVKATDTTVQVDESVTTLVRKLKGQRATPRLTSKQKDEALAAGQPVVEKSASQMGYDTRLDSFDKLIKLLGSIALYTPNEPDLKVLALTTLYNDLKAKNSAVTTTSAALSNARLTRNDLLYKPLTGMVDIGFDTKTYIKSLYGVTSPQYKQISKIAFRTSMVI